MVTRITLIPLKTTPNYSFFVKVNEKKNQSPFHEFINCPTRESFTHMEISPLPVKKCKIRTFEQGGIFIVPQLWRRRTLVMVALYLELFVRFRREIYERDLHSRSSKASQCCIGTIEWCMSI
jgi:hypothetical protein